MWNIETYFFMNPSVFLFFLENITIIMKEEKQKLKFCRFFYFPFAWKYS